MVLLAVWAYFRFQFFSVGTCCLNSEKNILFYYPSISSREKGATSSSKLKSEWVPVKRDCEYSSNGSESGGIRHAVTIRDSLFVMFPRRFPEDFSAPHFRWLCDLAQLLPGIHLSKRTLYFSTSACHCISSLY